MPSIIRSPKDFWAGVIYIFLGVAAIIIGKDYGIGTATKMGAAYFPVVLGGLLAFIGAISLIRAFAIQGDPISRLVYKEAAIIIGSIVLFALVLRGAGLPIALILLVLLSAYTSKNFRWLPSIGLAVGLALFCTLVFVKGLGIPLPILGSWFGG